MSVLSVPNLLLCRWQGRDDVSCNKACLPPGFGGEVPGQAVQVHAQTGRLYDPQALTDEGGEDAGEDISGASGGHAGVAAGIDKAVSIRGCHHGGSAFEDDGHAHGCGQALRRIEGI